MRADMRIERLCLTSSACRSGHGAKFGSYLGHLPPMMSLGIAPRCSQGIGWKCIVSGVVSSAHMLHKREPFLLGKAAMFTHWLGRCPAKIVNFITTAFAVFYMIFVEIHGSEHCTKYIILHS
jgi:hypothetical protein